MKVWIELVGSVCPIASLETFSSKENVRAYWEHLQKEGREIVESKDAIGRVTEMYLMQGPFRTRQAIEVEVDRWFERWNVDKPKENSNGNSNDN